MVHDDDDDACLKSICPSVCEVFLVTIETVAIFVGKFRFWSKLVLRSFLLFNFPHKREFSGDVIETVASSGAD